MYLCYRVAVLTNELFRLEKKRKEKKEKEKEKEKEKKKKKKDKKELLFKSSTGVNTLNVPSH